MLKAWLAKQTRSRGDIAREIGITPTSLWRIAHGQQNPSSTTALAIERVTGIPAISWADAALRDARAA